ncbi:MAG: mechanosensitive ion channel [Undibacterium sp.]|nr:mechanosensitive ion channel [Opitutaceae bacterium]
MIIKTPPLYVLPRLWVLACAAATAGALAASDPSPLPALLTPGHGETATAATAKPAAVDLLTAEAINGRRAALAKEQATARAELVRLADQKADETSAWLSQEIGLLDRIDRIYTEQLATLQHGADLAKESAEVEERAASRRPPGANLRAPYGLPLLDRLYDERGYLEQAEGWMKTDVANATEALRDARGALEEKDRARRTARDALKGPSPAKAQGKLRLAELESRLAQETLRVREQALRTLKFQQSLLAPKLALLRPDLDWLLTHLAFTPEEIAAAADRREKRNAALQKAMASAKTALEKISGAVTTLERKAGDGSTRELELRRSDRQSANEVLELLSAQRERLAEFDQLADQRRRALNQSATRAEMLAWDKANRDAMEALVKTRRQHVADLIKARGELQDLAERLTKLTPEEASLKTPLTERDRALRAWMKVAEDERSDLDAVRTARLRLQEEIGLRVTTFSLTDTWRSVCTHLAGAWDYELFSVQDQPVRVKTLLTVLVLLGLGFALSRRISAALGRVVFRRLGLSQGRSAAWQTLFFYGLCLIIILTSFNLFHLSLTQFSVVSGALAVGLGFGSQALLGNFISGIILLIERPVSKGDVITLDGQEVTVERIGPRSTIVHSGDNTHIVVPNSQLLDRAVINWTLSDDIVRRKITLGIAHGSPTREVDRLLTEVLANHPQVLKEPAPRVEFLEIGENAMRFEAVFWCHLGEQGTMTTELRHRFIEALTKAGIALALPQRDVHLSTAHPLQITVTPPASVDSKRDA